MPWIGPRYSLGVFEPPYFDGDVGAPDNNLVPQWPTPSSRRIAPRWRWITEPLRRPMAQRLLMRIDYSANDPASQGGEYDFTEWTWLDLFAFQPFDLFADPGVSPYATKVKGGLKLLDGQDGTPPGIVVESYELETPGDPAITLTSGCLDTMLWRKPPLTLAVGPGVSDCAFCDPPLPSGLELDVAGAVLVDPAFAPSFDRWANGTFGVSASFSCTWSLLEKDSESAGFEESVIYEVRIIAGQAPGTVQFQVTLVHTDDSGFPVTTRGEFVSADIPTAGGVLDCASALPLSPTYQSGVAGRWDWSAATATIKLPAGAIPGDTSSHNYPWKRITTYGFSECYPVDTFADNDREFIMLEKVGVLARVVAGQSVTSGVFVNFEAPFHEFGGQWWDPLGNANEIVVPEPWNHIRCEMQYWGPSDGSSADVGLYVNGSFDTDATVFQKHRQQNISQSAVVRTCSLFWLPVVPGDIIQMRIRHDGAVTQSPTNRSYLHVQGRYFPTS